MAPEPPRSGAPHHRANPLHLGVVAMHLALRTGPLALAEQATVEAPLPVVRERPAFAAQSCGCRVLVAAVDAEHLADRRELARDPLSSAILKCERLKVDPTARSNRPNNAVAADNCLNSWLPDLGSIQRPAD